MFRLHHNLASHLSAVLLHGVGFLSMHRYIIVVEHDLSVLDYLSDFICCLYGVPSCYGVVTMPFSVREGKALLLLLLPSLQQYELKILPSSLQTCCMPASQRLTDLQSISSGINIFLDGYVPTENLRFRETSLVFKVAETANEEEIKKMCRYQYPKMRKAMGDFELAIVAGEFTDSEIMVMLGENGE